MGKETESAKAYTPGPGVEPPRRRPEEDLPALDNVEPAADPQVDPHVNPHADKYNDPRARVTGRGIACGVGVVVLSALAAAGSIYARRTRLEQTTRFYGPAGIAALQLAPTLTLASIADGEPIDLQGTPSLGHLRRALLDERHFDWTTLRNESAHQECDGRTVGDRTPIPACVTLSLSDIADPPRFADQTLAIDLETGWVGPADGSRSVRLTPHVRPKLRNYFETIYTVEQLTYDERD